MSDTRQDWAVDIQEEGRCGRVNYRDPDGRLSFYWEFGGADAVALIQVGDAETWRQQHAWALPRRGEILRRVAAEVIRQRAPNCRAEVDDRQGWITLYQVTSPPPPPPKPSTASMYFRLSALKARVAAPDGYLMVHTSAPGLAGTLVVARVDPRGNLVWTADTGIDRFKLTQILPDPRHVAFIGTRPAVAGQVPEPILVSVDTQSGALSSTTLWQ